MRWMIAAALAALAGCATPPGKLSDADLVRETYTVNAPLSKVYAGLQENARHCGGLLAANVPEWYPGQDGKSAKVDLYLPGGFGGKSEWVYGLIDLEAAGDDATRASVAVQTIYNKPLFAREGGRRSEAGRIFKEIEQGDPPSCK